MRSPVNDYLQTLHDRHVGVKDGAVADYIPELAAAEPDFFGISMVTTQGAVYEAGDTRERFTIQSISKPLTYGLALEELGEQKVREHIGVEPTGDAFNSITLDPVTGTPLNPMVNAGAIAAVGILDPSTAMPRLDRILDTYSAYAGRNIELDEAVRAGEARTGDRNRAIAYLLHGSGAITDRPEPAVEDYFSQCSALVDCTDLAMIAATLANGGVNPRNGRRAASEKTVRKVLSVMVSCGMYNRAGNWLYTVGLPAKSGVAGGIIAVLPGQLGIGVFSPRLDEAGNSVRGVLVCEDITRELGLHPIQTGRDQASPVHTRFRLDEMRSKRWRSPEQAELIQSEGRCAGAFELQGDLDFAASERAIRAVIGADLRFTVLDFHRVNKIDHESAVMLADLCVALEEDGRGLVLSSVARFHELLVEAAGRELRELPGLDLALEWCEDQLLGDSEAAPEPEAIELRDHSLLSDFSEEQLAEVVALMERHEIAAGEHLFHVGDVADRLYLVTRGRLSAFIELRPGEQRRVSTAGPGGLIGEIAFVTGSNRSATVRVDSDVEYWTLPHSSLRELRNAEPALQAILLRNLLTIVAIDARMFQRALQTLVG
ncbi:MAG: glutaminase A [Thermoleophilaceae bacterium]|nr:glutaminase A [Thermoleophilaceae bacterium]